VVKLTKADIAKLTPIDPSACEGFSIHLDTDDVVLKYDGWDAIVYSPSENIVKRWALDEEYWDGEEEYLGWALHTDKNYAPE
jgi:hypothetical protein